MADLKNIEFSDFDDHHSDRYHLIPLFLMISKDTICFQAYQHDSGKAFDGVFHDDAFNGHLSIMMFNENIF